MLLSSKYKFNAKVHNRIYIYIHVLPTAPADFITVTSNITLSASERIVNVSVDIVDDEAVELEENFFLRIAVIGGLADAVVQDETQVIILNNDGNNYSHYTQYLKFVCIKYARLVVPLLKIIIFLLGICWYKIKV